MRDRVENGMGMICKGLLAGHSILHTTACGRLSPHDVVLLRDSDEGRLAGSDLFLQQNNWANIFNVGEGMFGYALR
jgi:hypothetical protein